MHELNEKFSAVYDGLIYEFNMADKHSGSGPVGHQRNVDFRYRQ